MLAKSSKHKCSGAHTHAPGGGGGRGVHGQLGLMRGGWGRGSRKISGLHQGVGCRV